MKPFKRSLYFHKGKGDALVSYFTAVIKYLMETNLRCEEFVLAGSLRSECDLPWRGRPVGRNVRLFAYL